MLERVGGEDVGRVGRPAVRQRVDELEVRRR